MPHRKKRESGFCLLPGYNWCGPRCNGPGPPVNEVDAACMMHDRCYDSGRSRCECDREFLDRLYPLINPYTETGRHARLVTSYMRLQTAYTCSNLYNRRH